MWEKVKKLYSYIFKILVAFSIVGYGALVFITLSSKSLSQNQQILTFISLIAVLLSIPGIVNTISEELNPKKKKYKLTCNCPKCKHLIQMDMVEE